jgi:hypothetical protein
MKKILFILLILLPFSLFSQVRLYDYGRQIIVQKSNVNQYYNKEGLWANKNGSTVVITSFGVAVNSTAYTSVSVPLCPSIDSLLRTIQHWISPWSAGGTLPSGTVNQTLRHDGTAWKASSLIYNTGVNVGIGTTSPSQKLDINGTVQSTGIKITTSPSVGAVLTSDAAGNGTWQGLPGAYMRSDAVSITTTADTTIAFSYPIGLASYTITYTVKDVFGHTIGARVTNKTVNGFTVAVFEPATIEYQAIIEPATADIRAAIVVVGSTADVTIAYSSPLSTTNYTFTYRVYDSKGHSIGTQIKSKTVSGFTLKSFESPVTIEYQAIKYL